MRDLYVFQVERSARVTLKVPAARSLHGRAGSVARQNDTSVDRHVLDTRRSAVLQRSWRRWHFHSSTTQRTLR